VTTPPSKGLVVELYLIYFGLAQSFAEELNELEIRDTVTILPLPSHLPS
jgi:hypothetical protein